MSRVIEGTSMGGFVCDHPGCTVKAFAAPVICVPWKGFPTSIRRPVTVIRDLHVCLRHQDAVRLEDELSKGIRDLVSSITEGHNGRPDFARAYFRFIRVHSAEFQEFLEKNGLVKPGDATPAGEGTDLIMP
jgi:hypothetical protein